MSTLLVCGKSFNKDLVRYTHVFSDFSPNPKMEDILAGAELLKEIKATEMIAAGGGSAIDVAKAIKYYADFLDIRLTAIPTTAGSGSDATRFAVIYKNGEKLSIEHEKLLPDKVLFFPELLSTLPLYIKQASLLDAWAQAIESLWNINATGESEGYSRKAIELISKNYKAYLSGDESTNEIMLTAANLSGKAINITKTTAPHAMSYKLTTIFGIAHGHGVALTLPHVYREMKEKREFSKEIDIAVTEFETAFNEMGLETPKATDEIIRSLVIGVNVQRLQNSPVQDLDIEYIYRKALEWK